MLREIVEKVNEKSQKIYIGKVDAGDNNLVIQVENKQKVFYTRNDFCKGLQDALKGKLSGYSPAGEFVQIAAIEGNEIIFKNDIKSFKNTDELCNILDNFI